MDFFKSHLMKADRNLASIVENCGPVLFERISFPWESIADLISHKINYIHDNHKDSFERDLAIVISKLQQIEFKTLNENPSACHVSVTSGKTNFQTLSLKLKLKLSDMKVSGTVNMFSTDCSCNNYPFELTLKNMKFELLAGLVIRGDSFFIEAMTYDPTHFDLNLSVNTKDKKLLFLTDNIEDPLRRASVKEGILKRFTSSIMAAVIDVLESRCVDSSVSTFLHNEYNYRNILRLHFKKIKFAFGKLFDKVTLLFETHFKNKFFLIIKLPELYGKLLADSEKDCSFKATEGFLKNLAFMHQTGMIFEEEGESIILTVFFSFSQLNMFYKNLIVKFADSEKCISFNTPKGCFSSCIRATFKVKEISKKINITLLDLKIESLRYDPSKWHISEKTFGTSVKREFGMWINYALNNEIALAAENLIKTEVIEILKKEDICAFNLNSHIQDDEVDSDPLNDEEEEKSYEEVNEVEERGKE